MSPQHQNTIRILLTVLSGDNTLRKEFEMIKVSVNGEIKEININLNVNELIEALGYEVKGFAVAVNTTFVAITSYDKTIIQAGDTIDILAPVQGG